MDVLELIDRIRSGRDAQAAQDELYRIVQAALLERLRNKIPPRLAPRLDAEDVVNTAFLRALASLDRFQASDGSAFIGWVYTISRNLIADVGRRRSVISVPLARGEETGPRESQIPAREPGASDELGDLEWVEAMLGELKPEQARVIRLRLLDGLTFEEIGEHCGKTRDAVKRHYARSVHELRKRVQNDSTAGP